MRRLLVCSLLLLPLPAAGRADDAPPKGEVTKYTFDQSKIFPGTTRDYWVYVPKQYNPEKPACVYVNQDGIQYKAPEVFDELIHKKEMPVTIGVFVRPGVVKAQTAPLLAPAMQRSLPSFDSRIARPSDAVFFSTSGSNSSSRKRA